MIVADNNEKACFAACPPEVVRNGRCSCQNRTLEKMKAIAKDQRFANLKNRGK